MDQSTINKFGSTIKHVKELVKWKYRLSELPVRQLNYEFISNFEFYLKSEKNIGNNIVEKHFNSLNRVLKEMVKQGMLRSNPFANLKIRRITPIELFYLRKSCKR